MVHKKDAVTEKLPADETVAVGVTDEAALALAV